MANIKRVILYYCNLIAMKKFSWLLACLFTLTVAAQEKLVIMGKSPHLYVVHIVGDGESLQSISNQFGQSVTRLSSYNGKTVASDVTKGERFKIPVTEYNLLRIKGDGNNAPLYHIVQKGDNLYRISQANKVTLASLKEWNNLTTDIIKNGQAIIVGFMVNAKVPADVQKSSDKAMPPVIKEVKEIAMVLPKMKATVPSVNPGKKSVTKFMNQPTEKFYELEKAKQMKENAKVQAVVSNPAPAINKKEEIIDYIPKDGDEGYFATAYSEHDKSLAKQFHSGDAATFKTISGWTDRKYYVLLNDVAPETIVRITGTNNKSICAKVLGPLQETKDATGLLLRMSNSAASTLGIAEAKFTVTVTYFE